MLANLGHWNENAIKARAQAIADLVEKVWAYPSLPPELLAQRKLEAAGGASGEENGKLTGELKRLFEQLRERELLAAVIDSDAIRCGRRMQAQSIDDEAHAPSSDGSLILAMCARTPAMTGPT